MMKLDINKLHHYGNLLNLVNFSIFYYFNFYIIESIQTTCEVFSNLKSNNIILNYARIPITPGRCPEECDFDDLIQALESVSPDTYIIFNCQMGQQRSTIGMVVAYLIKRWLQKEPIVASDFSARCMFLF
jgi:hypothetical protein